MEQAVNLMLSAFKELIKINHPDITADQKRIMMDEWRADIKLDTKGNTDALDKFALNRSDTLEGIFSKLKGPDGKTEIFAQLKDSEVIKATISQALKLPPKFDAEAQNYKTRGKAFNELLKEVPERWSIQTAIQLKKNLIDDGRAVLTAQHKHEEVALKAAMAQPAFTKELEAKLGTTDATKIQAVKDNMIKGLAEEHKKQLKEFDATTQTDKDNLHKSAGNDAKRLLFLACVSKDNQAMKDMIAEIAFNKEEANKKKVNLATSGGLLASIESDPEKPNHADVKISDLKTISTRQGSTITQENGKFSFSIEVSLFPPKGWFYANSNSAELDMRVMAQAVRASGHESIKFDIDFDNPEDALKNARIAYAAAIKEGFDPDKIELNITVNGRPIVDSKKEKGKDEKDEKKSTAETKAEMLNAAFKDHEGELNSLKQQSKSIREELADSEFNADDVDPMNVQDAKARLAEIHKAADEKAAAATAGADKKHTVDEDTAEERLGLPPA
jgi:hypothetical protein